MSSVDKHNDDVTNYNTDVLHVEIQQKIDSIANTENIIQGFKMFFFKYANADSNQRLDMSIKDYNVLHVNVESYKIMDSNGDSVSPEKLLGNDNIQYHIYRLFDNESGLYRCMF